MRKLKLALAMVVLIPLFMIVVVFGGCSSKKENGKGLDDNCANNEEFVLPYHLYNLSSECIAYTSNQYLYDYKTWDPIGIYDYERNMFIDKNGYYLGEITEGDLLLRNTQSTYINISLGTQATIPTGPVPTTAPTRATIPTLSSNWEDIDSINNKKYKVILSKTGEGSFSGEGEFEAGELVTITAIPADNYYFYGWYIDSNTQVNNNTYTFTMPEEDVFLVAMFIEKMKYTLTVSTTDGGWVNGSVSVGLAGKSKNETFYENERVNLHANTKSGYKFDGWYLNNELISSDKSFAFLMMDRSFTLQAKFSPIE